MIEETILIGLKRKFPDIHPLVFHRSVEKARTAGDLFDILYTIPTDCPFMWDDQNHRWKKIDDIMLENLSEELF